MGGSSVDRSGLAQEGQQRQQRQAEDGEEIARDHGKEPGAQALQPVGADGFQYFRAAALQVSRDRRLVEIAHGQPRRLHVTPPGGPVADDANGRVQLVGAPLQAAQVIAGGRLVAGFVEPRAVAFEDLIGTDDPGPGMPGRGVARLGLGKDESRIGGGAVPVVLLDGGLVDPRRVAAIGDAGAIQDAGAGAAGGCQDKERRRRQGYRSWRR